tara:strand:+ start:239 stop:361 length:123 start_codon:yes stop_codon:yes gene_type:complete
MEESIEKKVPQEGIMIEEANIEDTSTVEKKISLLKMRGEW